MPTPNRGEVWIVDLGMAGKVRPCVVLSVPAGPQDRRPGHAGGSHDRARESNFEVAVRSRFLTAGVFDAENMLTVPHAKLVRKLGSLPPDQLTIVEDAVRRRIGLW